MKYFIFFVYLPLGISVALMTPGNILDYRWAHIYTDFMASWLPYVAEVGRLTKVPATQFIAAMMNTVAILLSLSLIYSILKLNLEGVIKFMRGSSRKDKWMMLFGIVFFLFASCLVLFIDPIHNPPGSRDRFMIGSNVGMGLYGSFVIACGWILIAMVIVYIIAFFIMIKRSLMLEQE